MWAQEINKTQESVKCSVCMQSCNPPPLSQDDSYWRGDPADRILYEGKTDWNSVSGRFSGGIMSTRHLVRKYKKVSSGSESWKSVEEKSDWG